MGSEWRKVKLEELVAIEKRNINPQDYKDEYFLHYSIPAYDEGKCPKLEKGMNIKSNKFLIDHNYILLSKLNPRIERVWLPKKLEKKYKQIASTEFIPLLPKANYDRVYCYYLLKFPQLRAFMVQNTKGTSNSHQRMDIHSVLNYEIEVPPLPEQQKIVSILSAFDDKIELNNEMNKTLEEIAQAIFKHWFIDFEFPNENGEPYKSSGGEFVDSELGPIPKGWKVGVLADLCDVNMGQSPPSNTYNADKKGIPFYQGVKDFGTKYPSVKIYCSTPKKIANERDILLSVRAPVGEVNVAIEKCCIGRGLAALRMKKGANNYLYYLMLNQKNNWKVFESGSVFAAINKSIIENLPIIIPPLNIIEQFNTLIQPIDERILNNTKENAILSQLRDILLPKLISGEIRVM